MSVIRKLLIQGVRSFDPQNQDIIEFYAPLTIIVGQNGCGKTTIIECLKYITTGELPPNSKGGAFIHDPKLAGETEVKAQVKLRFNNVSQRSMTCVRSMLLSQKKATVSQKTLEGALSFDATATEDKVSISSRCADLDAMLPEQLGVSKAVLENVIFCHQEESNWPLSEASVLKKKFDEIFAATRYTKALESIKTIRKDKAVEIRVQRGELKHLEEKRTKSERVRAEYEKSTVAIHEYKTRIDGIQRQEEQVTAQIESLAERLQEFMTLCTTVQGLKMSLDEKVASYREMEANTRILEVSDDELQTMGTDIQRQIESQGTDNQRRHEERDNLQQQLNVAQREIDDMLSQIGRLQAARDSLESMIESRAATIAETISAASLSSSDSQDADCQAEDCAAQIETRLSHAEAERVETRRRAEARERELQTEINSAQSQIYDFDNAVALSDKRIASNVQEIHGLKAKHDALQPDMTSIKRTEDELASEKSLLATAQAQDSERVYNEMAKQKRLELGGLAEEIARLNSEIMRNNSQANTRAKLALRKSELESKQARRNELAANNDLAKYTPSSSQGQSRAVLIKNAIESTKKSITEVSSKCKEYSGELANKKMRLDMAIDAIAKKEAEMGAVETDIYLACTGGEYEETVSHYQSELQTVLELAGHYKSASSMYKAYIKKVETDHACPVCLRGWSNKADETKLISKLKLDYTTAPTELLNLEKDIRTLEKQLSNLHGLRSRASELEEWKSGDKDLLEGQIKELRTNVADYEALLDNDEAALALLNANLKSLTELLAKSDELDELERECSALTRQIETHEHELLATGSIKTADELQREISAHQLQESAVRRELDRLGQDHIIKQKEIGFRQDNIRRLQDSLSELSRQADERAVLLVRVSELEKANVGLEAEGQAARGKAEAVAPQLQQCKQRLTDFRSEARGQEALIDKRVRDLTQCKDQLALISREISNARAQLSCTAGEHRYADRLEQVQAQRQEQQERLEQLTARLNAIVTELRESDRIAAQLVTTQREISDNIRLRANRCEQGRLDAELKEAQGKQAQLESQLSQIYNDEDVDESDSDCEMDGSPRKRLRDGSAAASGRPRGGAQLQRRRDVLHAQLSRLTSERAGLQGETKQLEDQARRLARELSTDYRDINELFVKQLVVCKTEELANGDLETYGKALDSAIMRYHSLKMQDINKIIRELWINTYQGNDIDTIEIRSEMEGARNSRSHNYRVVMIKGGHAIDMRGRCSAGQKVLACLIIRLALAETFSVNCGILALDEPTTNLDQENIDSLARSLARIIKSRQEQRNFQLIVITHDEIFMQLLGKSEYADYYWRVYKDENQCSVFARRSIANN
ncbi:DNA repair protein rad50 [Coemansia sp. 'formosensis']|nr:DNA repair protein rad50 [Coemansia sp. 'formosensis']